MKRKNKLKQRKSGLRSAKLATKKASRKRKLAAKKAESKQRLATHPHQGIGVSQAGFLDDFGTTILRIQGTTPIEFKLLEENVDHFITPGLRKQFELTFQCGAFSVPFAFMGKIRRPVMVTVSGFRTRQSARDFLEKAVSGVIVRAAPELAYVSPLTQESIVPIIGLQEELFHD